MGIIANPASGKDIRRLVAFGSVFDNQEKVRIVRRVILGLVSTGVNRICYMPDYFGIVERALDRIKVRAKIFPLDLAIQGTQDDSTRAAGLMEGLGADCVITIGGDGTNRAAVKGSAAIPILPISTGTNNVFPFMVEGTLAGIAAGAVAMKQVSLEKSTILSTVLEVLVNGKPVDLALVDAVVCDEIFIGSRAVWDIKKGTERLQIDMPHDMMHGVIARFSPDERLVLASASGMLPTLFDATTGKVLHTLVSPGRVQALGFSKNGRALITVGADSELRVWKTSTGEEIARFVMMEDGEWIVLTSSGAYNGSEHAERHLHVLTSGRTEEIDSFVARFRDPETVAQVLQKLQ